MATPIPANEATFTIDAIARATRGTVRAAANGASEVRGVVVDSRAVRSGSLFVALRGEKHDAHRFLPQAVAAGAGAVLVARGAATPPEVTAIEVDDTLRALGDLAAEHRRRWGHLVVGITGSAGKTSTKELAAAALEGSGLRVHKTAGNLNNLVGLPMVVFALDASSDVAVLEMGTSQRGEIARLAEIAAPDVGVVTVTSAAHTEGIGSIDDVADEKAALLLALGEHGVAIASADDPRLVSRIGRSPAKRRIAFGASQDADVRVVSWEIDQDLRTACVWHLRELGRDVRARLALLGEAAAHNGAAALAVAIATGADVDRAAAGMESVEPGPGRMRALAATRGALVLDDSYNANPRSVAIALETAARVARLRGARLVAVLGDMKELGDRAAAEHAEIGRRARDAGVAVLVCVGSEMARAAETVGSGVVAVCVPDADAVAEALEPDLADRDVVLVKGSRSMLMERVVGWLGGEREERSS